MKGVVIIIYGSVTCVKVIVNLGKKPLDELYNWVLHRTSNFYQVATIPWVGTIGHSGPFGQASPVKTSALPIIGKSIVMYLHAHTDTYVRSVGAPIHPTLTS
jgi:hypothetical protein